MHVALVNHACACVHVPGVVRYCAYHLTRQALSDKMSIIPNSKAKDLGCQLNEFTLAGGDYSADKANRQFHFLSAIFQKIKYTLHRNKEK